MVSGAERLREAVKFAKSGRLVLNSTSTSAQTVMNFVLGSVAGSGSMGASVAPRHKWAARSSMLYHWQLDGKMGRLDAPVPPVEKQIGLKSANLTFDLSVNVRLTLDSEQMTVFRLSRVAVVG